ncbi:MAG: integration host factor subunit beta [Elusimicrobia bacterium]|nr:integration host factor subunit beta [Candidatus Liberimonas magnetica]
MNKIDLIQSLTKVLSTKKEAKDAIETIFSEMQLSLKKGDKVVISGFGSFHPFTTKTKKCRNPKTGETMHISPRKKIRFRQAKDFF